MKKKNRATFFHGLVCLDFRPLTEWVSFVAFGSRFLTHHTSYLYTSFRYKDIYPSCRVLAVLTSESGSEKFLFFLEGHNNVAELFHLFLGLFGQSGLLNKSLAEKINTI